jgi:hypothetical protein
MRRIFGTERKEVTGDWRKQDSEELHDLYSSPDMIKMRKCSKMREAEGFACRGENRDA